MNTHMKKLLLPFFLAALLCAAQGAEPAQELIATRFSETDGKPEIAGVPEDVAQLPLKAPTEISIQTGETVVSVGKEPLFDWQPPYLFIRTGGLKGKPEYPAWASVQWNLEKLRLTSGKYELSWKVMTPEKPFHGGSMTFSLLSQDGKPLKLPLPPDRLPFRVAFTDKGYVRAADRIEGGESFSYGAESSNDFVMTIDLDRKVWSASVNGILLADNLAFDEKLLAASSGFQVKGVYFLGSGVPGTALGLSDVRLIKLPATP